MPNFYVVLATGIIPLLLGALWYSPFLFNNVWMREAEMTEAKMKSANMIVIFIVTLILGMFLAVALMPIVIHQMGVWSVMDGTDFETAGSVANTDFTSFMTKYGQNFRSFKHGALHGTISGIFIFLPVLGINALFERKSWTYIFINVGFWTVCAMLMGGIICAYA